MTDITVENFESNSINTKQAKTDLRRSFFNLTMLSLKRYLFTRYMTILLMFGLCPLLITLIVALKGFTSAELDPAKVSGQINESNRIFFMMFRTFYIHFIIFFVANIFGFSLLRKEIEDQTLHYLFLQPVNKTFIILSKYSAYVFMTWIYLSALFLISYIVLLSPLGFKTIASELFQKGRVLSLIQSVFVMLAALLIYGAISMTMGSVFKSQGYGVFFYFWEVAVPYLPSTMKYFTVSHYLQAITPERSMIPEKMFALIGELPSVWLSLVVMFFILAAAIGATAFIIRQYECRYS